MSNDLEIKRDETKNRTRETYQKRVSQDDGPVDGASVLVVSRTVDAGEGDFLSAENLTGANKSGAQNGD